MSKIDTTKYGELQDTIETLCNLLIETLRIEKKLNRVREIDNVRGAKLFIEIEIDDSDAPIDESTYMRFDIQCGLNKEHE
jgi:hypothetical protein